jgi:hypothetical protein
MAMNVTTGVKSSSADRLTRRRPWRRAAVLGWAVLAAALTACGGDDAVDDEAGLRA